MVVTCGAAALHTHGWRSLLVVVGFLPRSLGFLCDSRKTRIPRLDQAQGRPSGRCVVAFPRLIVHAVAGRLDHFVPFISFTCI